MINFKLKDVDNVQQWIGSPYDETAARSVSWFALTHGEYWLNLGNVKFYEYTDEILRKWGDNCYSNKVADHQIYDFIQNFSELFSAIGENIPDDLFQYIKNPEKLTVSEAMFDQFDELSWEKYGDMLYWVRGRQLREWQFTNTPNISFFRQHDNAYIVWRADQMEEGIPVWTAKTGVQMLKFSEFVKQIEKFGQEFSAAMDAQIQNAIEKDWRTVEIDKTRLWTDQQNFKNEFADSINELKNTTKQTDWNTVRKLIAEICSTSGTDK